MYTILYISNNLTVLDRCEFINIIPDESNRILSVVDALLGENFNVIQFEGFTIITYDS